MTQISLPGDQPQGSGPPSPAESSSGRSGTQGRRVLTTYTLDLLCGGGFSILLMGLFLLLVPAPLTSMEFTVQRAVIVNALINQPHFIASYFLLYGSGASIRRYRWAAVYFPLLLAGYCGFVLYESIQSGHQSTHYTILYGIAAFYLAIHYTGQAWGTTATFSYLEGFQWTRGERRVLRSGLWVLAAWQMVWVAHQDHVVPADLLGISYGVQAVITLMAIVSFAAGLVVIGKASWRQRRHPPLRVLLPWTSIYLWYVLIQLMPGAFFWLQISHAVQYMAFPLRVELNRQTLRQPARRTTALPRVLLYYAVLVGLGAVAFSGITLISQSTPALLTAGVVAAFINIHHYFVDGSIWKISNPAVRHDLFAHVPEPS